MFKVLIIDDEPIIRKGLKNAVNWSQFECEVCGEAADGAKGCEMIRQCLPDIIITDIRMPEIDGLSMIRSIKDDVPNSKIIILTGYRDFDYAHEAIKLGAFDLLLKPTRIEELNSVIKRAVQELKFQGDKAAEINKLKNIFEQNVPVLREKLLYNIMYEINSEDGEINSKMDLFDININRFVLILAESENDNTSENKHNQFNKHLYQFGIINSFNEVFSDLFNVLSVSLDNKHVAFITQPLENHEEIVEDINSKCNYLQEIVQNCFGFTISLAVSSEGNGVMELPNKLKECQEALGHKFYIGSNSIIYYNDLNVFFKCEDYSLLEKNQKALIESIKAGDISTAKNKLGEIFNYINTHENINSEYLKNFYWNTISSINSIRLSVPSGEDEKSLDRSGDLGSLYKMMGRIENIKELNDILDEASVRVAGKVNSFNNRSIKLIMRKAVDYLTEHYNEPITLNEVAENAYVSTYYISRMFKKELGKNFVDYLNEIRIEKAKELLNSVKYKTYEVAEMVGIPDPHYFSKLFKKYVGVTPTEYRESQTLN